LTLFQAQVHDVALTCLTDGLPDDVQEQCESNILLCVDSPKMEQVVRNFLTNALKFTPRDGAIQIRMVVVERCPVETASNKNTFRKQSATVHVGLPPPVQLMLRVEVVDSGPGISAENLPKLFGQYVQFDANTLQGGKGSGLGLWLSKAIVEMHGGVIGATSPGPGQGCTFFMEVPCINADPDLSLEVDVRSVESVMHTMRSPVSIKRAVSPQLNRSVSTSNETDTGECKSYPPFSSKKHEEQESEGLKRLTLMSPESTKNNSPASTNTVTPIKNSRGFGVTTSGKVVRLPPLSSFSPKVSPAAPPPAVEKSGRTFLRNIARILPQPSHTKVSAGAISPRSPIPLDCNSEPSSISIRKYDGEGRSVRSNANSVVPLPPVTDLKVLIVDDSALARKMVDRSIAGVYRVCHHANNGQEALQMVIESLAAPSDEEDVERPRDPPYDVILMDYYMPVMSGPEAVRRIRDAGFQGVILGVTGNTSGVEHDSMTSAGADRVLVKPFNLEAFKQIVAGLFLTL
jgi:CheY-like chemotaxis protein